MFFSYPILKSLINFTNDILVCCFQNAYSNEELTINYGDDS